jgi:PST family polysaccharide transporter
LKPLVHKAAQGVVWTIGVALASRGLGMVGTLVLTRFLAPEVMGEVITALVVVFVASWLTQLGANQYVLVRGDEQREPVFHATVLLVGLALLALGVVCLVAPHVAPLFDAPRVAEYLPGLALAVFIRRLGSVPDKLLLRRMRFRTAAAAAGAGEIAYTGAAIGLVAAQPQLGGMAIVLANILQACVVTGVTVAACGVRSWLTPVPLRWARFKEIVAFGLPLGVEGFFHEAARYGDKLLFSRLFGTARTGEYNLAYSLADLPASYVGEQVSNVLLPTLMQVDAERRPAVLLRAIGLLALVTFPMAVGLAAIAPTLVAVLLSAEWQGVGPFLAVLATVSVFRPINVLIGQYLISVERNRVLMSMEIMRTTALFGGLFLLGLGGPVAAALAVGLASLIHMCGLLGAVGVDGRFVIDFVRVLRGPVLSCAAMTLFVLAIRETHVDLSSIGGEPGRLLLEVAGGAAAYCGALAVFGRGAAAEALALAQGMLHPKRALVR